MARPIPYYEHAGITIFLGDCRDILPQLGKFDLLLTDPPYGSGYAANPIVGKGKTESNHAAQDWDNAPVDDFAGMLGAAHDAIVWGGNYYALTPSRCWLAWHKPDAPPSMAQMELAWVSRDRNARMFSYSIAATNPERVGHPTQKPLALMKWCISLFPTAKTLLDPFCGSGTSLVAAKEMGLSAVGIEREEKYVEIAAKRLSQEVFSYV